MRIDKKGWLVLGLCLLLVVFLVYNAIQAMNWRSFNGDAQNVLKTEVDSALADLDSAVYLDINQTNWNDPGLRLAFYKSLLQTRDASAAAAQLAPLCSGDPATVAGRMGELQARLDAVYLPAAQRLAVGQATASDRLSLDSFCDAVRKAGWPLRAQFRDSGWVKLQSALYTLSQLLGPAPSMSVIEVPDYPGDQSAYSSGQTTPVNKSKTPAKPKLSPGITVKAGPAGGA
jgi:hypothetical protein